VSDFITAKAAYDKLVERNDDIDAEAEVEIDRDRPGLLPGEPLEPDADVHVETPDDDVDTYVEKDDDDADVEIESDD
jgi:hypothetical protein